MPTLKDLLKDMEFLHFKHTPIIHPTCFIAPGAQVIGNVQMGAHSSLWFNSIARGDVNSIRIGERTNIQDLSMIHVSSKDHPTIIGDNVTVGHGVILHACTIGNRVLIGMGALLMDGVVIEDDVIIGAGSLLTKGTRIPKGTRALGRPAKVVGEMSDEDRKELAASAERYVQLAAAYLRALRK